MSVGKGDQQSVRIFFKLKCIIERLFANKNDSVDIEVDGAGDEGIGCRSKILQNMQRTEL